MTERRLLGKVALITGSDTGIGQATAVASARCHPRRQALRGPGVKLRSRTHA